MRWIALLRGINVSGQKIIRMELLRAAVEAAGLQNVQTYIQSGNLVFDTNEKSATVLADLLHACIEQNFGFQVPVWVIQAAEIEQCLRLDPFQEADQYDPKRCFYGLLSSHPNEEQIAALRARIELPEEVAVHGRLLFAYIPGNAARSQLDIKHIEKTLQCKATLRNQNTLKALLKLAEH